MLYSVIIPAFNAEHTLAKAIESCLKQTLIPFEIFVVNDGSMDKTSKVAQQYFPHVKLIELKENKGVAYARNVAWEKAKGNIVAFLDSDDEWHPKKLETINKYWKDNEDLKCIFHTYTLKDFKYSEYGHEKVVIPVSFWRILLSNNAQTSCVCVRRAIPFKFNPYFKFCEDHELMVKLAWHYRLLHISSPLTKLGRPQLTEGGLSGEKWNMRKGELKIYMNLWKLNPLFIFLIPPLAIYSLLKYFMKLIKLYFNGNKHRMR